jgi:hypothetical protein
MVYNMKNRIGLLSILLVAGWTGCGEDDENTPSVAKDLKVFPGKYRAMLEFATPEDAKSYKIFYNNGEYLENPVSGTDGTQNVIVDGLPESEQVLRVVILNGNGIISDPKGIKANIYGDNYQSMLNPRRLIEQNTLSSTSVELIFAAAEKDETGVFLVFTNTAGVLDSVQIDAAQTVLIANNIHLDKPYYFYSVYKPETDAIDDFRSATVDAKNAAMFNFEKEKWTIAGFSDQEPGTGDHWGLASNIIDDDVTTFWHSQVVGAQSPMPHWITVDMQSEKTFDGFYFVQTQEMSESGLAKGFRFEISSDNNSWTNVLEGEFSTSRARQEFVFARQVTARYFKITILSGYLNAFWSQFAEIDLYNELNVSGMNGSIALDVLVNAKPPFRGENPVEGWTNPDGSGRFTQLVGWTHNEVARVSYDTDVNVNKIVLFSIPDGGIPYVTNGKVYQTVSLQPGSYMLAFDCAHLDWGTGVFAYGVATTAATLPDITGVTTDRDVLGHSSLSPNTINKIWFTLSAASSVTIGWVYNTFESGGAWSTLYMNGIELYKDY